MLQRYKQWNSFAGKLLWGFVLIGILAALPLAYERMLTEKSAKKVEIVFDFRDLIEISQYKSTPQSFIDEQIEKMKELGINSMAVYESTLGELELSQRLQLFSSREASILTKNPIPQNENYTYLLFANNEAQQTLQPIIENAFSRLGADSRDWTFEDRTGLIIEMPIVDAVLRPMDPDPITMQYLHDQGFQIAVRLSDSRPFVREDIEALLIKLKQYGVKRIIFGGDAVTGYADDADKSSITAVAQGMNGNGIGAAAIEMLKKEQKGLKKLAYLTDYNIVRLHSLPETEANETKSKIADRLVLAVKDRNIRMIYLNAAVTKDPDTGLLKDPLHNLYVSLQGSDGAIQRIEAEGYPIGIAEPFSIVYSGWQKPLKAIVLLGGVALIALTMAAFIPQLLLLIFSAGIVGTAGLYGLSPTLLVQAMALGVGICAPALAVIAALRAIKKQHGLSLNGRRRFQYALLLFLKTILITFIAVVYIVALLNHITYSLVLEQFRGVSILHLFPIALAGLYVLFFNEALTITQKANKIRTVLSTNINVLWVFIAGAAGVGVLYYLSRTGNEGQVSAYERIFRALLENNLGVRPRTKEFLAHSLFIFGAYLSLRYRSAVYLFIIGVIGQLSIVDTFAHLHTPIYISLIRVFYGALIGIILGLVCIVVWEFLVRCWVKWAPSLKE